MHSLQDAAAEWIIAPNTALSIVQSFNKAYDFLPALPTEFETDTVDDAQQSLHSLDLNATRSTSTVNTIRAPRSHARYNTDPEAPFNDWCPIKLLEEYDPMDLSSCSSKHAYVADHVIQVPLSLRITPSLFSDLEVIRKEQRKQASKLIHLNKVSEAGDRNDDSEDVKAGLAAPEAGLGEVLDENDTVGDGSYRADDDWLSRLRDKLQPDEEIGWYMVVCEDEERNDGLSYDDSLEYDELEQVNTQEVDDRQFQQSNVAPPTPISLEAPTTPNDIQTTTDVSPHDSSTAISNDNDDSTQLQPQFPVTSNETNGVPNSTRAPVLSAPTTTSPPAGSLSVTASPVTSPKPNKLAKSRSSQSRLSEGSNLKKMKSFFGIKK